MSMKQMNDAINFDIEKTTSLKRSSINNLITNDNRFNGTNYFSFNGNSFHIKKHIKHKTTYLNYSRQNGLYGIDENEDNNSFLFYGKNGFINNLKYLISYIKMTTEMTTNEIKTTTQTITQESELIGTDVLNPITSQEDEQAPEIEAVLKPIYTKEVRKAIVKEIKPIVKQDVKPIIKKELIPIIQIQIQPIIHKNIQKCNL